MANVTVTLTGDEEKLLRALDKVVQKERALAEAAARTGDESAGASQKAERGLKGLAAANEGAFGQKGLALIEGYLTKLGAAASSITAMKRALDSFDQAANQSAEKGRSSFTGMAKLEQGSGGDPEKLKALTMNAWGLRRMGGAENMNEAGEVTFSLNSVDELKNIGLYGQMKGMFGNMAELANAVASIKKSMGVEETGETPGIVSKALAAAGESPEKAGKLLFAVSKAGKGMAAIGGTDEELLAAGSVLSTVYGADQGGTYLESFLKVARAKGKTGEGLNGALRSIMKDLNAGTPLNDSEVLKTLVEQTPLNERKRVDELITMRRQKKMTDAEIISDMEGGGYGGRIKSLKEFRKPIDIQKYFGDDTSLAAFEQLRDNIPLMNKIMADEIRGEKEGSLFKMLKAGLTNPDIQAARAKIQAEGESEYQHRILGIKRNLSDAAIQNYASRGTAAGNPEWWTSLGSWTQEKVRWATGSDDYVVNSVGTPQEKAQYEELTKFSEQMQVAMDLFSGAVQKMVDMANNPPKDPTLGRGAWHGHGGDF